MTVGEQALEHNCSLPIRNFVFKVASRCNLACGYCYMYRKGDDSYRDQPFFMDPRVVRAAANRIGEHLDKHGCSDRDREIWISIHGGEPLLYGKERIEDSVSIVREVLIDARFSILTNGSLLDKDWLTHLRMLNVHVGVSLDGPKNHHDLARPYPSGVGSHESAERAVKLMMSTPEGQAQFSGTLSVLDPALPAEELYAYFRKELRLFDFDILLPDHHHCDPPIAGDPPVYGQYLTQLFDLWMEEGNPQVRIGFFEDLLGIMMGKVIPHAFWGLQPLPVVVVETDGGLEPPDYFKSCAPGITKTRFNVLRNTIDCVMQNPIVDMILKPRQNLSQTCRNCVWLDQCGGGLLSHRYSLQGEFRNPSVYCADLIYLMEHVYEVLCSSASFAALFD